MGVKTSTNMQANRAVFNETKTDTLTTTGYTTTTKNIGTCATGVTAAEYGDAGFHRTVLTVKKVDATGLVTADNAALASGTLLYTFPAGTILVDAAHMSLGLTNTEHAAETPDGGLGTVIGSTAVADLGSVGATSENLITGQTFNDMAGTAEVKGSLPTTILYPFYIASGDAHTVYFNLASTWANTAGADNTVDLTGTVTLLWRFLA
jgi:hypothetical protein